VAQEPNSGLDRLIIEISRPQKLDTHTHSVGLLWKNDKLLAEAATYTTHNKHKRRTSVPLTRFEPAVPAIEQRHTYA
jgi:hypothetical protein